MGSFDLTFIEDSSDAATSSGVVITANSTANTKGAYTEIFSSTTSAAVMLRITFTPTNTNITECLIDFATGAAASEVNFLENIKYYADSGANTDVTSNIDIIVAIPASTRLSAQMQAAIGSDTFKIIATLYSSDFTVDGFTSDTFGADTSNSRGSLIPDPGTTINTLGAYTEITSSTPEDITHVILSFGNNANIASGSDVDWLYQISTGAASSEVVKHAGIFVAGSSSETLWPVVVILPLIEPSGTRLAIRCQSTNNNAIDRFLDVTVTAVNSSVTAAGGGGGIAHIVGTGGIVG